MLAGRPPDVLDNLLSEFLRWSSVLSHLRSYERYDEPETLPYSICPFCPTSPDVRHLGVAERDPVDRLPVQVRRVRAPGLVDDVALASERGLGPAIDGPR